MDRKRLKFLLLGGGIVLSMGLLMVVGMGQFGGFSYYFIVIEFKYDFNWGFDGFRINGKVVEGLIVWFVGG